MISRRSRWAVVPVMLLGAAWAVAQPEAEEPLLPGLDIPYRTQLIRDWPRGIHGELSAGSFSSDGAKMCYTFERPVIMGPSVGIAVWDVLNSTVAVPELITTFRNPSGPKVSPDGRSVLFYGVLPMDAPGADTDPHRYIWKTDLVGSTPVQMTSGVDFEVSSYEWRPDGDMFAFLERAARDPQDVTRGYDYTLALIRADEPQKITREVKLKSPNIVVPPFIGGLRYSPDGQWLGCGCHNGASLGVIDPDTGRIYLLFEARFTTLSFSRRSEGGQRGYVWLPDSQRLLVTVTGGDEIIGFSNRIWMINLAGEARNLCEGRILGGPINARILFIEKGGQVYRVDFE